MTPLDKIKEAKEEMFVYHPFLKIKGVMAEYRDWLLGGKDFQWSVQEDAKTGGFILKRW